MHLAKLNLEMEMTEKKEIELFENERLDDLLFDGLKIIQNKKLYCFSSDAVLLCNFVKAKRTDSIVDLCSGSGIVGILAQAKTGAKNLVLVEKQTKLADMCKRSLELNNLKNAMVLNEDIKDAPKIMGQNKFDVVCANPPYYLQSEKKMSGNHEIDMAKFEIELDFDLLCSVASKLLKFGGKFFVINDSSRIAELVCTLKKYQLEPKILEFCFPKADKHSNVVLIEATKNGKAGTKVFFKNI